MDFGRIGKRITKFLTRIKNQGGLVAIIVVVSSSLLKAYNTRPWWRSRGIAMHFYERKQSASLGKLLLTRAKMEKENAFCFRLPCERSTLRSMFRCNYPSNSSIFILPISLGSINQTRRNLHNYTSSISFRFEWPNCIEYISKRFNICTSKLIFFFLMLNHVSRLVIKKNSFPIKKKKERTIR